jgi:hypothetical protein
MGKQVFDPKNKSVAGAEAAAAALPVTFRLKLDLGQGDDDVARAPNEQGGRP